MQSLVVCDLKVWPELENVPKRQEKREERGEGRGERGKGRGNAIKMSVFVSFRFFLSSPLHFFSSLSLSLSLSLLPRIESGMHW